jgi:hypothetical protein
VILKEMSPSSNLNHMLFCFVAAFRCNQVCDAYPSHCLEPIPLNRAYCHVLSQS